MTTFYDASTFEPFDITVSSSPPITLHGHRSTDAHGANKPPLVLIHGFPQTHLIYHKIAPAVSAHFNLVIPDLRGYGGSSKPASPGPTDHTLYSKSAMAADISALMRILGHPTYHVCGHDRGARVTHALCVSHPAEVRRAMLLDICPTLAMYRATDQAFATAYWHWFFLVQPAPFPEDAMATAPGAFAAKMLGGLPRAQGRGAKETFGAAGDEYAALFRDRAGVHAMCEDYRAGIQEDCAEQEADEGAGGRKIRCPLRVLWGKMGLVEKKFNAVEDWAKVCEEGMVDPKSEALESGHYIPEEVPRELEMHILDFFKE